MRWDIRIAGGQSGQEPGEFARTIVPMFGQVVALLAMKYGRAPMPVAPSLLRRMIQAGRPTDVDEMTNFARRFLFLRDERMFLAELKQTSTPITRGRSFLPSHVTGADPKVQGNQTEREG